MSQQQADIARNYARTLEERRSESLRRDAADEQARLAVQARREQRNLQDLQQNQAVAAAEQLQARQQTDNRENSNMQDQLNHQIEGRPGNRLTPRRDITPYPAPPVEAQLYVAEDEDETEDVPRTQPPDPVEENAPYPEIDTHILEREFFDESEKGETPGEQTLAGQLLSLRAALLRDIDRIDAMLEKLR